MTAYEKVKWQKHKGFSLVELMIAAFLGLILIAGVISLFISSRQSFRVQEQLSNVQTDGRFALMFIERFAENAGWFDQIPPSPADPTTQSSAIDFAVSQDGGGNANDVLSLQMEALAGTGIDCNGSVVPGTTVRNDFFVVGTTLLCQGNGGAAAQPVIENVESFQVLYGVDADADGVIDRYLTATQVIASGLAARVVAVNVGLLIASAQDAAPQNQARTYQVADVQVNTNDRRLRRAFNKSMLIPNQAFGVIRTAE
jgi:type IV pilus assembly protein PilW